METYFTVEGMIRGYHVYKDVWNSNIGEMLPCTIERSNGYDPNAIVVMKGGTVVGHLPRKISFISKLFLELEGSAIECEVISGMEISWNTWFKIKCSQGLIFATKEPVVKIAKF